MPRITGEDDFFLFRRKERSKEKSFLLFREKEGTEEKPLRLYDKKLAHLFAPAVKYGGREVQVYVRTKKDVLLLFSEKEVTKKNRS